MPLNSIPGDVVGSYVSPFLVDNAGENVVAVTQCNKISIKEQSDIGTQAFLVNEPVDSTGQARHPAGGMHTFYAGLNKRYKPGQIVGKATLVNVTSVQMEQKESVSDSNATD